MKSRTSIATRGGSRIVCDGEVRLIESRWYREKRAAIEAQVRAKYAEEIEAAAGFWAKVSIKAKIRKESRRELQKIGGEHCLW
jgi:hypothetical protein